VDYVFQSHRVTFAQIFDRTYFICQGKAEDIP
jgi:hypothetical protein